ncbi:MAG: cytochrome b/b6 domain-containing protein [bacterium]|nr:cytochrome b/b6 domain-containing protein [bacterium]
MRQDRYSSGRHLSRIERIGHLILAVSILLLLLTNGGLLFTPLQQLAWRLFGNTHRASFIHRWVGLVFSIGLIIILSALWREYRPYRAVLSRLRGRKDYASRGEIYGAGQEGRFTQGQKVHFLSVILGGILASVSGFILCTPYLYGQELVAWSCALHAFSATFFAVSGIIHIGLRHMGGPIAAGKKCH